MAKKHIKAPLTYDPGKGRPKEHLAYLNYQEMQALKSLNGNNMEYGPRGLPSFPPDDALGSSSKSTTTSTKTTTSSNPTGGSLSAPNRTAPSSGSNSGSGGNKTVSGGSNSGAKSGAYSGNKGPAGAATVKSGKSDASALKAANEQNANKTISQSPAAKTDVTRGAGTSITGFKVSDANKASTSQVSGNISGSISRVASQAKYPSRGSTNARPTVQNDIVQTSRSMRASIKTPADQAAYDKYRAEAGRMAMSIAAQNQAAAKAANMANQYGQYRSPPGYSPPKVTAGGAAYMNSSMPASVIKALADRGYNPDGTKKFGMTTADMARQYGMYRSPPGAVATAVGMDPSIPGRAALADKNYKTISSGPFATRTYSDPDLAGPSLSDYARNAYNTVAGGINSLFSGLPSSPLPGTSIDTVPGMTYANPAVSGRYSGMGYETDYAKALSDAMSPYKSYTDTGLNVAVPFRAAAPDARFMDDAMTAMGTGSVLDRVNPATGAVSMSVKTPKQYNDRVIDSLPPVQGDGVMRIDSIGGTPKAQTGVRSLDRTITDVRAVDAFNSQNVPKPVKQIYDRVPPSDQFAQPVKQKPLDRVEPVDIAPPPSIDEARVMGSVRTDPRVSLMEQQAYRTPTVQPTTSPTPSPSVVGGAGMLAYSNPAARARIEMSDDPQFRDAFYNGTESFYDGTAERNTPPAKTRSMNPSQEPAGPAYDSTITPEAEQAQQQDRQRVNRASRLAGPIGVGAGVPGLGLAGTAIRYADKQVQKLVDKYQDASIAERAQMEKKYPNLIAHATAMGIQTGGGTMDDYHAWAARNGLRPSITVGGQEPGNKTRSEGFSGGTYAPAVTPTVAPTAANSSSNGYRPYLHYQWDLGVNIPSPGDANYTEYMSYLALKTAAFDQLGITT